MIAAVPEPVDEHAHGHDEMGGMGGMGGGMGGMGGMGGGMGMM